MRALECIPLWPDNAFQLVSSNVPVILPYMRGTRIVPFPVDLGGLFPIVLSRASAV